MTKLTREQKAANYKALPVALIQKPLKFIKNRTMVADEVAEGEKPSFSVGKDYLYAQKAAEFGYGDIVQAVAKKINMGVTV
jgi:hypothetical protein